MRMFLANLTLESPGGNGPIDTGAEEEIFRRAGYEAINAMLAKRWEESDEEADIICTECHHSMKSMGARNRKITSLCGRVTIRRRVYYCSRCGRMDIPLDKRLGIDRIGITPGMTRVVCRTALELPYKQSEILLKDCLGFSPCSAREIERVAKSHGGKIEERQVSSSSGVTPSHPRAKRPTYCLAIDAAMIPGLPDPKEHQVMWHDVKVAVLFHPQETESALYVAGRETSEMFGQRLWKYLEARGIDRDSIRLILGDGAPWIWNLADMHFYGVRQLLDFYHASEHLYATADLLWHEKGKAMKWMQDRQKQLKEGHMSNFFASLTLLARRHEAKDSDGGPQRLLKYFKDNQNRLDYMSAGKNHLPIGSGVVESAARHIVQQRLKLSGMRWSDFGAQAVLNLRTLHRSGEFEQYWEDLAVAGF